MGDWARLGTGTPEKLAAAPPIRPKTSRRRGSRPSIWRLGPERTGTSLLITSALGPLPAGAARRRPGGAARLEYSNASELGKSPRRRQTGATLVPPGLPSARQC